MDAYLPAHFTFQKGTPHPKFKIFHKNFKIFKSLKYFKVQKFKLHKKIKTQINFQTQKPLIFNLSLVGSKERPGES